MAVTQANYERREEEWKHQLELAEKELDQLDKQLAAANVRKAIAAQELQNHELQIENARAVDEFMRSKFTNRELYDWMVAQTSTLYFQAYQLAYDLARRAERAYGFERGVQASNFVQFGHWDSLRKGLLAGERLALDLKRLETAYMDQNRRDYELTRHVSLVLHDPLALIALKAAGRCTVRLPEALFDADHPGHYMRRIKSVALTIPAVVGPYTSVNCTLRLLSDKTRITAARPDPYAEQLTDGPDDRFVANYAGQQSIAVSHAQNDSGMFELNFRDERYLPFEGAGVISDWLIELPPDCNAFDLNTITDVVLRINYTARDGGDSLRSEARRSLGLAAAAAPAQLSARPGRQRLFSLKHEFAVEWFQFLRSSPEQSMRFDLTPERFPFEVRGRTITVLAVDVFVIPQGGAGPIEGSVAISAPVGSSSGSPPTAGSSPSSLEPFGEMYRASLSLPANTHLSAPGVPADYTWSLSLGSRALADILLVYTYTVG